MTLQDKVNNSKELAPAKNQVNTMSDLLEKMKPQIALALPAHMTADRFARIALTVIRTNPKLLECAPQSVLAGVMMSAQLGVELGLLGQAYLVPFFNNKTQRSEATFILGYKGMIDLARRSGHIKTIVAHAVYEGCKFNLEYGLVEKVEHVPYFITGEKKGELRGCYCIATFVDGGHATIFMPKEEIDQHRAKSKGGNYGPWVTDYEQMALKTVVRGIFKWLPISVELAKQVEQTDGTSKSNLSKYMEDEPDNVVAPDLFEGAETVTPTTVVPTETNVMPKLETLAKLRTVSPSVFTKARAAAGVKATMDNLTEEEAEKIMIVLEEQGSFIGAPKPEKKPKGDETL